MTEQAIRGLVAEVLVLRNNPAWRAEDDALIRAGAVLNAQVGGPEISQRASYLRDLAPGPLLLQADLETGSYFAADGTELPPLMALGAADSVELAYDWGRAVGLEGRRLGLDVTWSPVLDINTNPDNPIINVRSFGESAAQVGRLGAALTRGLNAGGLHPCAKHWPGHGDVAVDSHIALPTLPLSRQRLDEVEWSPYRQARAAGLVSVMTAHLLVPDIDPEHCATVSPTLIGLLRKHLGIAGPIFTDSLGMEGLRLTLDSAEAAWRALAAGHDQVLIDYKRPPGESVEAVVAACLDG
ncbi:MAG: glycosyl hydrolase family 3, partial [Armatimonadetes bacterium]|nr:glycosyl hydrolase family 3 [Armatimonadota bacterium]